MKILVTGIKGFLGRNLVELFSDHDLVGLGSKNEYYKGLKVYSSCGLDLLPKDFDAVIMCHAAVSSGDKKQPLNNLFESNVLLTHNLVEKFNNTKIVYASTASIFDIHNDIITEDSKINPRTDYAISKYWAEKKVEQHPTATIVRFSSLFGLGMKENTLIPNYVNMAFNLGEIQVWGNGERKQNYLHITDAAQYMQKALDSLERHKNSTYLGVAEHELSNLQVAKLIAKQVGCKIKHLNEDYSQSVSYNNSKTTKLLGWKPEVSFAQGINEYIKWKKK